MPDMHMKQFRVFETYGKEPETLSEVAEAMIAVVRQLLPLAGFSWSIHYDDRVPTTHSAPLNGERNWGGLGSGPRHLYPGFSGRIWLRFKEEPKAFSVSEALESALGHTGTGGSGSYSGPWEDLENKRYELYGMSSKFNLFIYSYDFRFYLSDFPLFERQTHDDIKEFELNEDKKQAWAKLSGERFVREKYGANLQYLWEDSQIAAEDTEFWEMHFGDAPFTKLPTF